MRRLLIAALMLASAAPALANDSTATTAAGGLVLKKNDSIAMVTEDLFVSVDQIRVRYRFHNISGIPVTTIVAFPMPPRKLYDEFGGDIAYPSNFRTSVDGKPVAVTRERKATVKGVDQTASLKSLNIPIAPDNVNNATKLMDALPAATKRKLLARGLVFEEEYDDTGKGMKKHLVPQWVVEDSYWWKQVFPAGRDVMIDHRYVPGAGGSVETIAGFPEFRHSPENQAILDQFCVDKAFITAIDARRNKGPDGPMMPDRKIEYILKTGANWAKPIGTFRLVVDKGKASNLVSFCGEGVKKIGPTQLEMVKKNWRPTQDLQVLVVEPHRR